ncbi:MAG: prolyl oligopeptidase family serine peptidase [bacterium]|nr:prolyl oligopeptidase family serine peptidase [bacterium]
MEFPQTKKEEIIEDIAGHQVADPYRWLEDWSDPEVKDWVDEQNKFLTNNIYTNKKEIFKQELIKNFEVTNFSNLFPCKGKYFYQERRTGENQFVLYVKNGLDGVPIELVNPNKLSKAGTITLDFNYPSRSGKYLAYGLSAGGDEMATLYVKNIETGKDLEDKIERCRYSKVLWLPDDSGFFYTRSPRSGEVPKNEEHLHVKVYLHKLGDDPINDEFIFGKNRDDMIGIKLSLDGRYLAISVAQTWLKNDLVIYDTISKKITPLVVGKEAQFDIHFGGSLILVHTNLGNNNCRVYSLDLNNLFKPIEEWVELISPTEFKLEHIRITNNRIIGVYLEDAVSRAKIFDFSGRLTQIVEADLYANFGGLNSNREEEEFFYGLDSFIFPKIAYRFDPNLNKSIEYRKTDNPINPDNYIIKQEWFKSKDGVKVPMFIFHKKSVELNNYNPTILYGYGGFGNNETPSFMRNWMPWLERGGVFALANIRGGGEFGEQWHKNGIKDKKQNSFDDFIAAAEHLIRQKYTSPEYLGIIGGSNGGLLVSAVAVQRPDLFKAVCSRVPLTDMVRFPLFGIASRWVHEYGDPNVKVDLENILTWSPYHNVKEGVEYPAFLFTTADKDTRVDPLHARKMAALLQSKNKINPVLILTEFDAGHGPGKPISKIVESQSIILSFFSEQLGLDI